MNRFILILKRTQIDLDKTNVSIKPFLKNFELELLSKSIHECFYKIPFNVNKLANQFIYLCKTNQHELIHKVKNNFCKTLSKDFVQNNFDVFQNSFQLSKKL